MCISVSTESVPSAMVDVLLLKFVDHFDLGPIKSEELCFTPYDRVSLVDERPLDEPLPDDPDGYDNSTELYLALIHISEPTR